MPNEPIQLSAAVDEFTPIEKLPLEQRVDKVCKDFNVKPAKAIKLASNYLTGKRRIPKLGTKTVRAAKEITKIVAEDVEPLEIIGMIKQEAMGIREDTTSTARIAALRLLAEIKGLLRPQAPAENKIAIQFVNNWNSLTEEDNASLEGTTDNQ